MFTEISTARIPTAEEAVLAKILKAYYFGEICPPEPVLRGFYDREFYEAGYNPSTFYRDTRCTVEAVVTPCLVFGGEPGFACRHTVYFPSWKGYGSSIEYWPASAVRKFSTLMTVGELSAT